MNTQPLNKMFQQSTFDELAKLVDLATVIQVARFDCLYGTTDGSNRSVARDGILYDEIISRLAVHGVTSRTERIVMACNEYEYDQNERPHDKIVAPLKEYLRQWLAQPA